MNPKGNYGKFFESDKEDFIPDIELPPGTGLHYWDKLKPKDFPGMDLEDWDAIKRNQEGGYGVRFRKKPERAPLTS